MSAMGRERKCDWRHSGILWTGNTLVFKVVAEHPDMLATKKSLVCAICALALSVTGCYRPIGPQSVARDRHLYAASLSDSWKEQTLLNIVKMRYLDPPVFVDVGNIVASYSLVQGFLQPETSFRTTKHLTQLWAVSEPTATPPRSPTPR